MITGVHTSYNIVVTSNKSNKAQSKPVEAPSYEADEYVPSPPLRVFFMDKFTEVGFTSPNGPNAALNNIAQKYYELRQELIERYDEEKETLYEKLSELNLAFRRAAIRTGLAPSHAIQGNIECNDTRKHIWDIRERIIGSMDTFFEEFINNIQNQSFQDAFNNSLSTALSDDPWQVNPLTMRRVSVTSGNTTFSLFVSPEGVWRLPEGAKSRNDKVLIDTSTGTPGIPQSEIRRLEYTARLLSHMPIGVTINPGPGLSGLQNYMQQLAEAFAAVKEETPNQHSRFIEDAFREEVLRTFNLTLQLQTLQLGRGMESTANPEQLAEARVEAERQANIFVDTFFRHWNQGPEAAFSAAWSAL